MSSYVRFFRTRWAVPLGILMFSVGCGSLKETVTDISGKIKLVASEFSDYAGTGTDGDLVVDGAINGPLNPAYTDDVRGYVFTAALAGDTQIDISWEAGTFLAGQEVLIIQMVGDGAGTYETIQVASVTPAGPRRILNLVDGLAHSYPALSGTEAAQVMKVPNYSSVTIKSGGFLSVHAWDGKTGGVLFLRSTGKVWIMEDPGLDGEISVGDTGLKKTASSDPCSATGLGGENFNIGAIVETIFTGGCGGEGTLETGGRGGGMMVIKSGGKVIVDGELDADGGRERDTG